MAFSDHPIFGLIISKNPRRLPAGGFGTQLGKKWAICGLQSFLLLRQMVRLRIL